MRPRDKQIRHVSKGPYLKGILHEPVIFYTTFMNRQVADAQVYFISDPMKNFSKTIGQTFK